MADELIYGVKSLVPPFVMKDHSWLAMRLGRNVAIIIMEDRKQNQHLILLGT